MIFNTDYAPPKFVEHTIDLGRRQYTINYDIERTEDGSYRWRSVTLPPGYKGYGSIVAAIISERYSANEVQAIYANFMAVTSGVFADLPPEKRDEYIREFHELTSWRDHAKQIAREAIEYIEGKKV